MLNSIKDFELCLKVSNLAKFVYIYFSDTFNLIEIKELSKDSTFIADSLEVWYIKNKMQILVLDIFKNIKSLKFLYSKLNENLEDKINLPQLESLRIDDMKLLRNFTRLE